MSVGKVADDPESPTSVSVLYSDALVWPNSIVVDPAWDSANELGAGAPCASLEGMVMDEDKVTALVSSEAVPCEDCSREPSSEDLVDEVEGKGALSVRGGPLELPGGGPRGPAGGADDSVETGQTVVYATTTSVESTVDFAGQLSTSDPHDVTVWILVL